MSDRLNPAPLNGEPDFSGQAMVSQTKRFCSRIWLWRQCDVRIICVAGGLRGTWDKLSPGPYRSLRELSLTGLVGPDTRHPPTL